MAAQSTVTTNTTIPAVVTSAMTNTKTLTLSFNIDQQCPIQYVTVYNDRAEVTRLLRHHFDAEGTYDLVFEGFSPFVDETSLHVSGGTGKACTILEVSYRTHYGDTTAQTDLTPLDQLQNELNKVETDINAHKKEVERLDKQRTWLDGRASKLMNQDGQVNANDLDTMNKFMDFYHKLLLKLDDQTATEGVEIKKLTQQKNGLKEKINQHGVGYQSTHRKECREVTITLHIGISNIDVNLEMSYLINNCSWSASYDVRVNSQEASKQQTQLTYYGIIVNKSQENWPDAQLSLSTAIPSLGGSPPKLTTLKIDYYRPRPPSYVDQQIRFASQSRLQADTILCDHVIMSCAAAPMEESKKSRGFVSLREKSSLTSKSIAEESEMDTKNTVNVLSTTAEASMSSTSFAIPRRSTIDADGKPHKVIIGILDLPSKFIYTVVPKLSLHAYLKASTINTSDKQLLAGPVSVFMDNNFVTHSSIDNVCLGDTFDLPLGTDAGVKVEYKPVKKVTDTQGLISKTHHENVHHETRLTNTKPIEITVYVYEQVPLSLDEKIKVKLLAPNLRTKEQSSTFSVTMNDNNNLEWKCVLQPKAECRLPVEYTLEWQNNKRVEFKEE